MDGSHGKGEMDWGDEMGRSKATKAGFPIYEKVSQNFCRSKSVIIAK